MAAANINVNKLTVLEFLATGQKVPFLIPEYQRPYSWSDDEINTLFDDIWNFSIERTRSDGAKTYFLGCIVSYLEKNPANVDVRQIIDGQQRLTSLFLLLRAIFAMLENEDNKTEEVKNFINKLRPALWRENEMTGKVDRTQMLLKSDVVSDSGNELLCKILETGVAEKDATDNYSKNYIKFQQLYAEKALNSPHQIFHFINALLNYTILLPIDADDQETALTIFNTLNNRGLPLSDADIFKSHIYKGLDEEGKKEFIDKWKKLEADSERVHETVQYLFYYHMFYLRAKEKDVNTSTPGVRKYYLEKDKNRLNVGVIDELAQSLHLWEVTNGREEVEGEEWSKNMDIRKILDCLSSYTNEFWKYPVSIFYMEYREREDFEAIFLKFLRKLYVMLITRFLEQPTISAVKGDIMKLNAQIISTEHPDFYAGFAAFDPADEFEAQNEKLKTDNCIIMPHRRVERMLLKLLAYETQGQDALLPVTWDIEHIFPQTWDTKYYTFDKKEAGIKLEHIGNKLPLEKKLNISASNNYFDKKKEKYKQSKIAICQKLGNSSLSEWNLDNIAENDAKICQQVKQLFEKWVNDYEPTEVAPGQEGPTPEELALIEDFRKRGLMK